MKFVVRSVLIALALLGFVLLALRPAAAQKVKDALPIEIVPVLRSGGPLANAISSDGKRLLLGGYQTVQIWDLAAGRPIRTLAGHTEVQAAAFTPDGARVLSVDYDIDRSIGKWHLWDSAGRVLRTLQVSIRVSQLAFLPDGKHLLGGNGADFFLLDATNGRMIRDFKNDGHGVAAIALSPDGRRALTLNLNRDRAKLWDVQSGARLREFEKISGGGSIALSPDGRRVLEGSRDGNVRLLDANTGALLKAFEVHTYPKYSANNARVTSVSYSPDGRHVLIGTVHEIKQPAPRRFGALEVWNVESGQLVRRISSEGGLVNHYAEYTPDGTRIVCECNGRIRVFDSELAERSPTTEPPIEGIEHVSASKDPQANSLIAAAFGPRGVSLNLWDLKGGALVGKSTSTIAATAVSADGSIAASKVSGNTKYEILQIQDVSTGKVLSTIDSQNSWSGALGGPALDSSTFDRWYRSFIRKLKFSKDGAYAAAYLSNETNRGGRIRVWETKTGAVLGNIITEESTRFTLSSSGTRLLTAKDKYLGGAGGGGVHGIWMLDVSTGNVVRAFVPPQFYTITFEDVGFSPNERYVVAITQSSSPSSSSQNTEVQHAFHLWDATTGQLLRTFAGHNGRIESLAFSSNGDRILSASYDKSVKLWDVTTGRLVRTFIGHPDYVRAAEFSNDARRVISLGHDSSIWLWNIDTGDLLARLISTRDGEWLVLTPEGFFSASQRGADLLSVVRGFDVWSIDQFYQSLYRPDLVREKLAGDPRGLVRQAAARLDLGKVLATGTAPSVTIVSPRDGDPAAAAQINAEAAIVNHNGGIGRVEWRVNGVTVGVDAAPAAPSAGQPLRLTRSLGLTTGSNEIEVVAYNGANLIASVPARTTVTLQLPGAAASPVASDARLFVLAAGVNDYADQRFRLAHAVSDAKSTAQAFSAAGKGHYRSVTLKVLSDADVTKEKLDAAFAELAGLVQPGDVFVLYLAGHGKTVDGRYYFVPQAFKIDGETSNRVINDAVARQGIAQDQWQRWLAQVPARKSVILLDTCESGTLTADEADTKALERGAANDRLAQATGRSIITASSGNADAFEGYRGHGLFTYNLLDAIERGDSDGNGIIDVSELAAYVYAQVTTLSEQIFKQRQAPQIRITTNYALTRQIRVLPDALPAVAMDSQPTHQLAQTAQLAVRPGIGQTAVRSLTANTPITVLKSEGGWSLVAQRGRPVGYVATKDLAPIR